MNDPIITDPNDHLPQNRIGMTVREEIASRVLAGALSGQYQNTFSSEKELIAAVIRATDDLIAELERTKK